MNWYHSVDISEPHQGYKEGTISDEELGPKVADILESDLLPKIGSARKTELKTLIAAFRTCDNVDDYDNVLEALYDWGDKKMPSGKLCWINTFPNASAVKQVQQ